LVFFASCLFALANFHCDFFDNGLERLDSLIDSVSLRVVAFACFGVVSLLSLVKASSISSSLSPSGSDNASNLLLEVA
jgi:hypothetical protein